MKRIIYIATALIVLASAGILLLPVLISQESISQRLEMRMAGLTNNKLTYQGEPKLSLGRFLKIELFDVALSDDREKSAADPLVYIEELKFNVKLLPLMFGKVRLSDFKLVRPKFNISVDDEGGVNRVVNAGDVQSGNRDASPIQLGHFDIIDGIVVATLAGKPDPVRISNLNAQISWPTLASPWEISGNGVWSGERFEFNNMTDDPLALFSSRSSAVKSRFVSAAITASFDGEANTASGIQLRGTSNIEIPSVPRLIELMGDVDGVIKPPFGKLFIDGLVTANTGEIRFDEANVKLGEDTATGNLQFYRRGEQQAKVSGTLAFDSLDMTPFANVIIAGSGSKDAEAKQLNSGALDMDVRFSAQSYQLGPDKFGALAATALVSGDDWTFDIGEAEFFDGMIVATIGSKTTKKGKVTTLKGALRNVSMERIADIWNGGEFFATGVANAKFDLVAKKNSALADFRQYSGSMIVSMPDGQLEGIDIIKAIPALEENNGFVTADDIKGTTGFGKLELELLVHDGVAWVTKGIARNETNEFRMSGKTDMVHGGLAIYTDIRALENSGEVSPPTRIFVGGTVRNPLVTRSKLPPSRPDERIPTDG